MIHNDRTIQRATVIGDGAMGTVCAMLLVAQGIHVKLWSRSRERSDELRNDRENRRYLPGTSLPETLTLTSRGEEAFAEAELVVSAIPCQYLRPIWETLAMFHPPDVAIVSVTKGIEKETLLRPTQILSSIVGSSRVACLSGPSIAGEIAKGFPATVVVAAEDLELAELIQQSFSTPMFRVYTNVDLLGVEIAAATKNIIALAAGMIDGLGLGDNAKAALLTRGLVEITRLGVAMGAHAETFRGLAGVGDLVTTCISPVGRNRSAGEAIGRGRDVAEVIRSTPSVIEGIPTTEAVSKLGHAYSVTMPITDAVHDVLFDNLDPARAIEELMTRQLKPE